MMDAFKVESNLYALNSAIEDYVKASGKTTTEVLVKQGTKLGFEIRDRFAQLMPVKGQVTARMLTSLRATGGIRIRDSIKNSPTIAARFNAQTSVASRSLVYGKKFVRAGGKKLNVQQFKVARELAAREKGRGYLAYAGRLNTEGVGEAKQLNTFGRYSQLLGSVGLGVQLNSQTLTFTWGGTEYGGAPVEIGEAINKPKQQAAVAEAIAATVNDIASYHRFDGAHAQAIRDRLEVASKAPLR